MLLLRFPELKNANGLVREGLDAAGADSATIATWHAVAAAEIVADENDDMDEPE